MLAPLKPTIPLWARLVFLAVAFLVLIFGNWFYIEENGKLRDAAISDLTELAESKLQQIAVWRGEQTRDISTIAEDPLFVTAVTAWMKNGSAGSEILQRLRFLQSRLGFKELMYVDTTGRILLSTSSAALNLPQTTLDALQTVVRTSQPLLSELYQVSGSLSARIDAVSVVSGKTAGTSKVLGALIGVIDVNDYLNPLIQRWFTPSETAETLLVRRAGNDVLFLNELRFRSGTTLKLRIPISQGEVPAVRAVLGQRGVFEGKDYRGVPVVSVVNPVPDSNWFLVSKMDAAEIFSAVRLRTEFLAVVLSGFLILLLIGLLLWGQRSRLNYYQAADLAQSALWENREYLTATLRSIGDAVISTDEAGRVKSLNTVAEKLMGYTQEEAQGRPVTEVFNIVNAYTRQPAENPVEQALKEGRVVGLANHTVLISKYGNEYQIADSAAPIRSEHNSILGVVLVFRDVTSEYRLQEQLAAEKEQLAVTLRSIGDAVISTDTSGRIVLMNRVAEILTAWTQPEAAGRPLLDVFRIINEDTRKASENPVDKVLRTGQIESLANHTLLIDRDGRERVIADSAAPIKNKRSETVGVVLVFRDYTEQRKSEEQIARAQNLASLGILAGGLAHDFNNMMSGVLGYIDVARACSRSGDCGAVNEYLSKALGVYERARGLTQQLLTFAKGGSPKKKAGDVRLILQEVTQFALSGSNVRAEFRIDDSLWPGYFDPHQISQVIENLVINGKHAMPDGGILEISADNVTFPEGGALGLMPGNYVRCTVRDHGCGISPENLSRVFDPFFTTKASGLGLGLSTSHSIIKQHDGAIEVTSRPGAGSTFVFYLPAAFGLDKSVMTQRDDILPGAGRILVMDDEEFVREISEKILAAAGYTVTLASNGDEAVKLLLAARDQGHPYTAVILDLTVPGGMGGKDTVKKLLEIEPRVRAIASSGYSEDPVMSIPQEFGFKGSICKPFRRAELLQELSRVLTQI